MAVTGRPNKGAGHVEGLGGGAHEKERLRTILQTITGEVTVTEACERLGIGRARFAELRTIALQGAVDALEPGRPGRPRVCDIEVNERVRELETECDRLRRETRNERLRAELARSVPELFEKGGS